MANLKNETLYVLHKHGKKKADVRWVGCEDFKIPLEDFWQFADNDYESGYGHAAVAQDLLVCGDGWWMERYEYDGAEWWEYKEQPKEPERTAKVRGVIAEDINEWWSPLFKWEVKDDEL